MESGSPMQCPNCQHQLRTIEYEGIAIETCSSCEGEWLDADELGKINRCREVKFDVEARRAIAESTTITGVVLKDVDRDLICPKCGGTTDALNFGGDSGIILDRCTSCNGFWLDHNELEKVQMLVEGWEDMLPDDLKEYGPVLRDVEVKYDREDDVTISRLPLVGGFINVMINGLIDLTGN